MTTVSPVSRPRLLLLIVGLVVVASAALIVVIAPRTADHAVLSDLSLPAIMAAGFLDGFNPCAFAGLSRSAPSAPGRAPPQSLASTGGPPDVKAASRAVLGLGVFFVLGVLV